jgi:hypothetical protein
MPRIRFDGPGHVLHAFGRTVLLGQEAEFGKKQTRVLRGQAYLQIAVDGRILPPLPPLTLDVSRPSVYGSRRQWVDYAGKQGVAVSDGMTREEIVAAVDATDVDEQPQPEAGSGEGQPIHPDKKEN